MKKSLFDIPKMDCPSEERIIRMAFDGNTSVKNLKFNLSQRKLEIIHENEYQEAISILEPLGFGAKFINSEDFDEHEALLLNSSDNDANEISVLKTVFIINAIMFFVGLGAGIIAESAGLLADSLDNFADATVFGLSIYAVGRSQLLKKKAARFSGYIQMLLALGAFAEVIRRIVYGSEPEANIMIIISAIALIANMISMYLLSGHRKGEIHMQASWIFLSNDVIANAGVILAGVLVHYLKSDYPDLIIGVIISFVVLSGSLRILKATSK